MRTGTPTHSPDPVTMEVLRHRLGGVAEEMQLTLIRSSFSTIVKEGKDASSSVFSIGGEPLAQALSVPIHLGALIPMVQQLLAVVPPPAMHEGDAFILNDPYLGGTHTPDIAIMMPVFADGAPVAITATMTHHGDIGGMTPGSVPTNATEIFQEGVRIPLLKLLDRGAPNQTLLALLARNVRMPDAFRGDLFAQLAACKTGAARLGQIVADFGREATAHMFGDLLDRSEQMTRAALRALRSGRFVYEDYLDNDGIDLDRPITIRVAVTVTDGGLHCDFTGSSPQVRGPFNCMPSGALAAACFALRAVTDPDDLIPNNGGCFRPITLHVPEGCVLSPREPAPVGCRSATIRRVAGALLGALREAAPQRVPADSSGNAVIVTFAGRRNGKAFVAPQMVVGGVGGGRDADGADVVDTDVTNTHNPASEAMEMTVPIRVVRAGFSVDSGGAGRHRGGLGAEYEYEMLQDGITVTYRGERHFHSARGSDGGDAGAVAEGLVIRRDGSTQAIASKAVLQVNAGDRILIRTAGGGGYGSAAARDPDAVRVDLADGKITAACAVERYRLE